MKREDLNMSISAGGIDFSKLYQTQATGNNGSAGAANVGAADAGQQSQGAVMDQFKKDVDFSKLKLQ